MITLEKISARYSLGNRLTVLSGTITPVLAAVVELDGKVAASDYAFLAVPLALLSKAAIYLYGLALLVFIVGRYLSRHGSRTVWEALQAQVDILQNRAFNDFTEDLNDDHRVTLFKHKKWCAKRFLRLEDLKLSWKSRARPCSGWLVPAIRSGHTGKETKAVFLAPDNGRLAEGIVGQCWSSDAVVIEPNLPKVDSTTSSRNKDRYIRRAKMPEWMLDRYCTQGRPVARSFLAYPVKTATGARWGVLVFDSLNSNGVDTVKAQEAFRIIAEPLGALLEDV